MGIKLRANIKKLNKILVKSRSSNSDVMGNGLKFYTGSLFDTTISIVKDVAPMSKVAVVCRKDSFDPQAVVFSDEVKRLGGKALNVILPNKVNSSEALSKMFALPDDIRLIIVADIEVMRPACYYASVVKIPVVLACENERFFEKFSLRSFVYSGAKLDYLLNACECHVVVDVKKFMKEANFAELFALNVSKFPALFDYNVTSLTRGENKNEQAYAILGDALKSTYGVFKYGKKSQKRLLLVQALKLMTAYYMSEGKIFDFGSQKMAEMLLPKSAYNGYGRILCAGIILKLYGIYLNGEYSNLLNLPNYVSRVETVAKLLKAEEKPFLVGLNIQLETLRKFKENQVKLFQSKVGFGKKVYDISDKLVNSYYALGGKGEAKKGAVVRAVTHSGDVGDYVNGISVVRESGILEILAKFI